MIQEGGKGIRQYKRWMIQSIGVAFYGHLFQLDSSGFCIKISVLRQIAR